MSKKKKSKKNVNGDVTINDFANASKPVNRVKKAAPDISTAELAWDEVPDDSDWVQQVNADGTKNLVLKKKDKNTHHEDNSSRIEYPEIVWYLISRFVKPEDVGTFALINKAAYHITRKESFWRNLYINYCQKYQHKMSQRFRIDNFMVYGLKPKVIRALHHIHDPFVKKVTKDAASPRRPHSLIKRRCINVWYEKARTYSVVYFKFKKVGLPSSVVGSKTDFFEGFGNINANPEEDVQVLQVYCQVLPNITPLMGLTLTSVEVTLSQGFTSYSVTLGFNSGHVNVAREIIPEQYLMLHTVANMAVYDWWHPSYPYPESLITSYMDDDDRTTILNKEFFDS